ncbi:hypothetical protein [Nonomuraea sp. NPDC049784]|uniref:hypothetical protein n=1 Tax=Nonomuraea sp. NPDC049784 TaxID=3154361 RepID=UPI0033E8C7E9
MSDHHPYTDRFLGDFQELPHERPDGPSLRAAVRDKGEEYEALLVKYLQAGTLFVVSGSGAHDVLIPEAKYIGPLAMLTDGQWFWYSDLAYYVERYHVQLSERFVEHVRNLKGVPSTVDHAELVALQDKILGPEDG